MRKRLHLAYSFIYFGVLVKLLDFGGSELEHANISLLGCDGGFDDIDFPLGGDGLSFNLLNQLINVSATTQSVEGEILPFATLRSGWTC